MGGSFQKIITLVTELRLCPAIDDLCSYDTHCGGSSLRMGVLHMVFREFSFCFSNVRSQNFVSRILLMQKQLNQIVLLQ